jgi:glutamate--cysteine ligase regulatory subunit
VKSLGIAEFGILRLGSFLPHIDIHPSIDQINLRDCCDVPTDLLEYTKKAGIKLMPHMDEDDPLPGATLQQVLDELDVKERVTDLRWVAKYTAIVKERGVVENKGFFNRNFKLTFRYIVSAGVA